MSWSFSPLSQEQKSQHCLLDDILFDDQDKSKKANQVKVHPFRVSSTPRLPPAPPNFDDFFSQSSQKDITSTQAFQENFSQFGKKIHKNTQNSRSGIRSLAARHRETPSFNYPESNFELFHSPPTIDLEVEDVDEEYMYPEDSPELFTPDAYSSSYSIREQGERPTNELQGSKSPNKQLIHRSQRCYDDSFRTPNPLFIPANTPSFADQDGREKLRSTAQIPEQFRSVFSQFPYFNIVQSRVFDEVFYSDKPLVICAPTGAGKTVIFELAIIRLLMTVGASVSKTKIVYMAPMKALCSERCDDWSSKFGPLGLKCREVTGDSELDDYFELQDTHIVTTTPEKWDSMTRKWKDNKSLVQSVRLFLVDEVHILNDGDRGATVEAVISRMKTVHTALSRGSGKQQIDRDTNMRLIAVSATIPNVDDIAAWIGEIDNPASSYSMDDSYRPVKLRKVVLGFPMHSNMSEFKFDLSLNYKLSGIIQTYSERKPTLVFCSTRKSTQQAANTLIKDARFIVNSQHRQRLTQIANSLHDSKLRELVICGVGYHHAGLDSTDRKSIENAFLKGELPVLFATSTLAVGVNLPAHLVIIKSTHCYQIGVYTEYSETQVLQMIGRAGRPQFDTSATAVIMTTTSSKEKWSSLLQGNQNIESSLHHHLIEHLNAEIVLHTISDVSVALEWLKSTFLFIRIQKNPTHYGIPAGLSKDALEQKLQDLCIQNLNTLEKATLIKMDDGFDLKPGEPGRLMARYCIAFDSIKQFLSIEGSECLADMVSLVSKCKEFSDVKLRVNEKRILNGLNKDKNKLTIRFPVNGKIKSTDQKVSCLIQATLGCLSISEFSLNQDVTKIFRCGQRVTRCLVELSMLENKFKSLLNAIVFAKCMKARLWENSKYVSKQIEKVGTTLSTMLVNAGLTTFKKIEETNPREIELIVNRHPPFGSQIREAAMSYPKYEVSVEQKGRYTVKSSEILISVTMTNWMKRQLSTGSKRVFHFCFLLIGDADNNVIYKQRLGDAVFFKEGGVWSKTVDVRRAAKSPELSINLISQDYVGVDVTTTFTPYYSGSYFPASKASAESNEQQKVAQSTPAPATLSGTPCNHRCSNKNICGHACCKTGIIGSRSKRIRTDKEKEPAATSGTTLQSNSGKGMNGFLDQLHQRTFALPRTPAQKRLKVPISTTPVSTGHVEKFSSTIAERFSYTRRPLLQHGSYQTPSSTHAIVDTTRPAGNYTNEVDFARNKTNLPRRSQVKQKKQLMPDDIYQGDDDFFSDILDAEDDTDDLPSLYEYGFSGQDHSTPKSSCQVKTAQGCASASFSGHNEATLSKTVREQKQGQKIFKERSNSFNLNRIYDEPVSKHADDDFFSVIFDQEDLPSFCDEFLISGTGHPKARPTSQMKADQGSTSAYFSNKDKTSTTNTVRDQGQNQRLFERKNNLSSHISCRIQDQPAAKRKSVADIPSNWVTNIPTKLVPYQPALSSRRLGWGDFQTANCKPSKSTTIPEHDDQDEMDDGREYDHVKRNGVTSDAIPKHYSSLSSKVPGWKEFKEMNGKAVQYENCLLDTGPDLEGPRPSKMEQEVADDKQPLVPVFFSSGANQRLQPEDDQDAFSDIFSGVF